MVAVTVSVCVTLIIHNSLLYTARGYYYYYTKALSVTLELAEQLYLHFLMQQGAWDGGTHRPCVPRAAQLGESRRYLQELWKEEHRKGKRWGQVEQSLLILRLWSIQKIPCPNHSTVLGKVVDAQGRRCRSRNTTITQS